MPSKYIVRKLEDNSYYHVFLRSFDIEPFQDKEDYTVFLNNVAKLLSGKELVDDRGRVYRTYSDTVELCAFAVLPTHFHFLLYVKDAKMLAKFMIGVLTRYSMYYNKKYNHRGKVFESVYKTIRIESDTQLFSTSRYINMNPSDWKEYPYSSLGYYTENYLSTDWINITRIPVLFGSTKKYLEYLEDFKAYRVEIKDPEYPLIDR